MKSLQAASLLLLSLSVAAARAEQMIPAGSVIQCTVAEPKISSQTMNIGDPVLCQVSHAELYGRSTFPFRSYLVGRFEDYKDPGHFVGKGWMELKFYRMVVQPDIEVPITARVIAVPHYPVDREGRILGKGHPVRDAIEWAIPVLWPIDLINLPRRGPRPVLTAETRLTIKVMDDIGIPTRDEQNQERGLIPRTPQPVAVEQPYLQPAAPIQQAYAQAPPQVIINQYAAPPPQQQVVVVQAPPMYAYPPPYAYAYPPPPMYRPGYYAPY